MSFSLKNALLLLRSPPDWMSPPPPRFPRRKLTTRYWRLSVLPAGEQPAPPLTRCLSVSSTSCHCWSLTRPAGSFLCLIYSQASLITHSVKNLPALREIQVGKIPWRREWQPTPEFLPGESHGQRGLAGYSPRGRRVRHGWATNTFNFSFPFCAFLMKGINQWINHPPRN